MARLRNVRSGAGCSESCLVKCHLPKSFGYCSTLAGQISYVFHTMLDRSTSCFGSPVQALFLSAQMISCSMQAFLQVMLSSA